MDNLCDIEMPSIRKVSWNTLLTGDAKHNKLSKKQKNVTPAMRDVFWSELDVESVFRHKWPEFRAKRKNRPLCLYRI
jgi:hypothetical protein